ncbi:radical SAM protein [Limibacterium fermenti]|uniref:radical SAM protein n=1 Tax=Limibacterium fermenti TaxID=3229863 RepID=UPI003A7730A0
MSEINIGVNLTRRCNMKCSFCYYSTLEFSKDSKSDDFTSKFDLSIDVFKSKIKEFHFIDRLFLTGGEPLIYPHLKELICDMRDRTRYIYVCTNATLVNDNWCDFFKRNNITLVISVKDNSTSTYNKINYIHNLGVNIELYHVLTKSSLCIIKELPSRYPWVKKVRLLFETSSDPFKEIIKPLEWFTLLRLASYYLKPIINTVEAEIGFLPKSHPITQNNDKGAVNRIIIDYDGKGYTCPLIVEKDDGVDDMLKIKKCEINKCPVIKKDFKHNNYEQICPFIIVKLESLFSN